MSPQLRVQHAPSPQFWPLSQDRRPFLPFHLFISHNRRYRGLTGCDYVFWDEQYPTFRSILLPPSLQDVTVFWDSSTWSFEVSCCLHPYGMWLCVLGWAVPDVSKYPVAFTLTGCDFVFWDEQYPTFRSILLPPPLRDVTLCFGMSNTRRYEVSCYLHPYGMWLFWDEQYPTFRSILLPPSSETFSPEQQRGVTSQKNWIVTSIVLTTSKQ